MIATAITVVTGLTACSVLKQYAPVAVKSLDVVYR